jgi:hypothetical protein
MAKITVADTMNQLAPGTNAWDIINALRNADATMAAYVPLANAENVAEVGAGILGMEVTQNAFIGALINRIAAVILHRVNLKNPLAPFKKGSMPTGYNIEEIFVDIAAEHKFNPSVAEEKVFQREMPNVKVLFHKLNRQGFYKQTISQDQLRNAFVSWDQVTQLITNIINAMYNSNAVDEFKYMKLLFSNYYSKGLFTVVKVTEPVGEASAHTLVQNIKAYSNRLTFPSDQYNALGVTTQTDKQDQHLFLNSDIDAMVDINILASAFNMDKASFAGHRHMIDDFGGASNVAAILVDSDFFMVYDQMEQMTQNWNGEGLYWNYFYHVWQVMSASRFANAVIFVYDTDAVKVNPITSVIVTPNIVNVGKGRTQNFSAIVHTTDDTTDKSVTWTVTNGTSSATAISADGVLAVGTDETAQQLAVKATTVAKNPTKKPTPAGDGDATVEGTGSEQNTDGTVSGSAFVTVQ